MLRAVKFAVGLLLLACSPLWAQADGLTCVARVKGDPTGEFRIDKFHDMPAGLLLEASLGGLFRYDGNRTIHVAGDPTGEIEEFHDSPAGLLLGAEKGLFRYDGNAQSMPLVTRLAASGSFTIRRPGCSWAREMAYSLIAYSIMTASASCVSPATQPARLRSFTTRRPGCCWARRMACFVTTATAQSMSKVTRLVTLRRFTTRRPGSCWLRTTACFILMASASPMSTRATRLTTSSVSFVLRATRKPTRCRFWTPELGYCCTQ
jgi:hypothetical protein